MADGRLPHLKRRADFLKIAKRGRKAVTKGMIVQALPRHDEQMHVGFTASRKVGGAVVRNRARRRMRALANSVLPNRAMNGHDYVLIARAAISDRAFNDLSVDLLRALAKLDVLRDSAAPHVSQSR